MVYSATERMVVLANLASGRASLRSCTRPGVVSWVAAWELLVRSSYVRQLEGWADGGLEVTQRWSWRCLVALGSHSAGDGAVVLGMVA
jgi:hypothetical protein